jgi:hypothetical protein
MAILAAKYYGSVTVGSELVESRNSINPHYLRTWSRRFNNPLVPGLRAQILKPPNLAKNNKSGAF